MKRSLSTIFGLLLLVLSGSDAMFRESVEKMMFDPAEEELPEGSLNFKKLFGRSFIAGLGMIEADCAHLTKQFESTFLPVTADIKKEYDAALKALEEEESLDPISAQELQEKEIKRLKKLLNDANLQRAQHRKELDNKCDQRKHDFLRNRMFLGMAALQKLDASSVAKVMDQLLQYVKKLHTALAQCKDVVKVFAGDPSICQEDAIAEAIQFIESFVRSLPSQINNNFSGFISGSGDDEDDMEIDDGSTPEIQEDKLPPFLMPGPVIIDPPDDTEDDHLIHSGSGGPVAVVDEEEVPPVDLEMPTTLPTSFTGSGGGITVATSSIGTVLTDEVVTTASDDVTATSPPRADDLTTTISVDKMTPSDDKAIETGTVPSVSASAEENTGNGVEVGEVLVSVKESRKGQRKGDHDGRDGDKDGDHDDHRRPDDHDKGKGRDPDDQDDNDSSRSKGVVGLYVTLLITIGLLVVVLLVMVVMVIILRRKAARSQHAEANMSEEDKLSLIKQGYVNPTYKFFDKETPSQ